MSVLTPGETCWRTEKADRVAFLVDTEAYFTALYEAMMKARRSILILGWGFDPRARLFPDGYDGPDDPDEVGHVLLRLAKERPLLDIRLLIWKSALPIAASQEFFPHKARKWFQGSPVKFHLDDQVPLGACHHQKVVIIDDRLAFCGGGDISVDRWDTPGHLDDDQRRIMPDQECHAPRHEVMMMVDSDAARALGEHFRARWLNATKTLIEPAPDAGGDPWPDHVPPHLLDTKVSIARTQPAWRKQPCVQEIRELTLACIADAKTTIYLENQYFTSPVITEALAKRLGEPNGPDIVLVTTGASPSWFDQLTMDHARGAMVWRLRASDVYGRFRAYHPTTRAGTNIIVHSKTSVFDDRIVRVGSANINNRSFGFDTEIELAVEAESDDERRNIAAFRDRLVGHFIGYTGDAVAKAMADRGGLIHAIEALNRDSGRLNPIDPSRRTPLEEFIAAYHLGDPADVGDAWRLGRRRERLFAQSRALSRR
ncbi:MAG: phospholipase [Alphaproteobacteria bacterium]|nr:phospholipase [Alphaproteobacteria bacterium]MBU1513067.1 phospholipase [Alphaproteobacteria bacterium]MBU2095175.1 phospholipase [Alphaproteobacteria bacterium]MBU2152084.1 phospholipase [Alphaproteobacteria bacterium]MBU2306426.1 phospholipase [Alphaproteobacteria bacterium]